jgi:hypothetical protein
MAPCSASVAKCSGDVGIRRFTRSARRSRLVASLRRRSRVTVAANFAAQAVEVAARDIASGLVKVALGVEIYHGGTHRIGQVRDQIRRACRLDLQPFGELFDQILRDIGRRDLFHGFFFVNARGLVRQGLTDLHRWPLRNAAPVASFQTKPCTRGNLPLGAFQAYSVVP